MACAPEFSIGMRPVPTWKSTAAAPTPMSEGPRVLPSESTRPSALVPWQVAQFARNSDLPASTSSCV